MKLYDPTGKLDSRGPFSPWPLLFIVFTAGLLIALAANEFFQGLP